MKARLLKLHIIPLLLAIGYLVLISYPYFFSKINRYDSLGPLSLVEEKSVNIQNTFSQERTIDQLDNHLLKGDRVSVKLKATENNFGIVLARFERFGKVSDKVVFRLKEEGKGDWYYENIYKAGEFRPDEYFTFGFPTIADSKNHTYVFEVESLFGTYKDGVGLSLDEPQVAFVYKYSRNDLKNHKILSSFIHKKFIYVANNVNSMQNWQLMAIFALPFILVLFMKKKKITLLDIAKSLPKLKSNHRRVLKAVINSIKLNYLSFERKIVNLSKKTTHRFTSTRFYLVFLNTNTKKRIEIGLLLFLLALAYRFSSTLIHQEGVTLFYAGLGGQGDYDQFIRTATCAVTNFCSAILGQNFLIESSILGVFFKIVGFTGGLKAYLYLMIILSSIVATLPYLLLSRKNWITIGGIIGSLFLVTSDFLTHISLNFPPDNGSLFTFSMFFIVYFLTLQRATIRWLLFFGMVGTIDGLNKALFLINNLAVFALFAPVVFFEKAKETGGEIFRKKNIKILFLSLVPLSVFLIIYIGWEYFVYIKFSAVYFLRGLFLTGGSSYVAYTSLNDNSLGLNIMVKLLYLGVQAVVMLKHLIDYADLQTIFLAPILLGMLSFSFIKAPQKRVVKKNILFSIISIFLIMLLTLIANNYFKIHEVFNGDYIYTWTEQIYVGIFLLVEIIILFILNFKYSAIKLSLPIIPYIIMLIIMAKNAPFPRLQVHIVVWSVILFAFLVDWITENIRKYSTRIKIIIESLLLILFISAYIFPKMVITVAQLNSGFAESKNEVKYLKWTNSELPSNAIVLAGGKSDLVVVAENVKKPIIFNTLWSAAVLIKPKEIPRFSPTDFSIIPELKNKDNFKKNKYIILEDDVYIWRDRVSGVVDNVFSTSSAALHASDYSIKVYKYNSTLKKAIYELDIRNKSN